MKIKLDKKLLLTIGISFLVSFVLTTIFALLSLLSWGIVCGLITFICTPLVKIIIDIYEEEECLDLQDLWNVLTKEDDDNNFIKPCD